MHPCDVNECAPQWAWLPAERIADFQDGLMEFDSEEGDEHSQDSLVSLFMHGSPSLHLGPQTATRAAALRSSTS
jgi:hypothetical protein